MAETQITDMPTGGAPLDRKTKDSERFELLAVNATFDGTSAASAFLPAVQVLSDSGREVGTFPTTSSVSAGGSADVTFAPFLRKAAAAAAGVTVQYEHFLTGPGGAQSFGANIGTALNWTHDYGDTLLNLTSPAHPKAIKAGLYAITATVDCDSGTGAVGSWAVELSLDTITNQSENDATGSLQAGVSAVRPSITISCTRTLDAGSDVTLFVVHNAAVNRGFRINDAEVVRLS